MLTRTQVLCTRPCLQEEAEAQQLLEGGYFDAGNDHEPHNHQQQHQCFSTAALGQLSNAALVQMRE